MNPWMPSLIPWRGARPCCSPLHKDWVRASQPRALWHNVWHWSSCALTSSDPILHLGSIALDNSHPALKQCCPLQSKCLQDSDGWYSVCDILRGWAVVPRLSFSCSAALTAVVMSHFRDDSFPFSGLTEPHPILCFEKAKGCKNWAFFCLSCYCVVFWNYYLLLIILNANIKISHSSQIIRGRRSSVFLLTKPANKQKQMLTCSSFLLFSAIYLFQYSLVASKAQWTEAEPSSFPSECLISVHTESPHKHPSSSKFLT